MNSEYQALKSTYTSVQSKLAAEVIKIAGKLSLLPDLKSVLDIKESIDIYCLRNQTFTA